METNNYNVEHFTQVELSIEYFMKKHKMTKLEALLYSISIELKEIREEINELKINYK